MSGPFEKANVNADRRLKIFLYGPSGAGKTTLSLQFPKPAMIDMEGGSILYGDSFDFHRLDATTADEVMATVNWLLENDHDFRTLIIDPITVYWAALQQKWSDIFMERNKKSKGYKFEFYEFQPRDWMTIKAEFKTLIRRLVALDMNVICTAHQKPKYADSGLMQVIGDTFDGEKSLPYLFDTVLHLTREGNKFMAEAEKDRTNKLPKGKFEIAYSYFAEHFGEEVLTRKAEQTPYITEDQKNEIENYIVMLQLSEDKVKGALRKYDAESLDDLTAENAATVLENLESKYNKQKEANIA